MYSLYIIQYVNFANVIKTVGTLGHSMTLYDLKCDGRGFNSHSGTI